MVLLDKNVNTSLTMVNNARALMRKLSEAQRFRGGRSENVSEEHRNLNQESSDGSAFENYKISWPQSEHT